MKKLLLSTLLMSVFVVAAQAQLLFKISGKELTKPSFIVGTHHLAPVAIVEQFPGIKEAMNRSEQIYGEIDLNVYKSPTSKQKIEDAQKLPEGKTLMGLLTKEQGKRLDAVLIKLMGVGMSNPTVSAKMNKMTPMAMLINLGLLSYLRNHMGEFDATASMDEYFQAQALANNIPVGGLETVDFQVNTIYKGMSLERQAQLLMCFVDNMDFHEMQAEKITNAYKAQNLLALQAAMDEKLNNVCDSTPEEWDAILYNRNVDWVSRMPAIMMATPTLFVVGAGHLPGEKGVLQLLRNAGYTVEAMQ